ncbi:hypothetical protein [Spongiimicrobium sp. 2-473A-2-J]|uniref:hypothetical protein n=1 Tax=Eudoraea algarum TaxID=3417568 RepID=UPI003D35D473
MYKRNPFLVLLSLLFLSIGCSDGQEGLKNPADTLPPPTRSGKQVFACLIDGKPFISDTTGLGKPSAFYSFSDGAYTLDIGGSKYRKQPGISVGIIADAVAALTETEYDLVTQGRGKFSAGYVLWGDGFPAPVGTRDKMPGKLIITRFDQDAQIISGTFEFILFSIDDSQIHVTDGRFDIIYKDQS